MVRIEGSTVIARSLETVFDCVADERNEPKYNPRMLSVEKLTPGAIGPGTRWAATIESRGHPLGMTLEVTDYQRPRRLASTTAMPTAEVRGVVRFEPHPVGTRMSWTWDLRPKGVMKVLTPLIARLGRRQEEEIWAGLKQYLESSDRAPRD